MGYEDHVTEYVRALDPQTVSKNRKILLFMDFYAANPKDKLLKNMQVVFLPLNCTSSIQALQQVIIRPYQHYYNE